ncbi:MAG: phosphomannomutase/phosphoglucomutase [bacterium]
MSSFFKAYDMRGVFGVDFDLDTVYRVGRWLPVVLDAHRVLVGRDARLTSDAIRDALCRGLVESGCAVDDMGQSTTPMVYFFTAEKSYDASIQITASHNPSNYNGMKVSRAKAVPVGYDSGLGELETRVTSGCLPPAQAGGSCSAVRYRDEFVEWLRKHKPDLSGLRYAVDCSDGMAGLIMRDVLGEEAIYLNEQPDGRFPHHAPNPLEIENCEQLMQVVKSQGLEVGVIFDGDADRVMFVDEKGAFIQPDYLIAVIAQQLLRHESKGAIVIHDIRTSRGVIEALIRMGATPVMGKVGHAFAKKRLRELGAVVGGELAGHYYFRDFFCCDSGEFAALIVLGALAEAKVRGVTLSQLIEPLRCYANSGEINFRVEKKDEAIAAVRQALEPFGPTTAFYDFDGIRVEYAGWWLNVRKSNTEPYLRLIVEARDDVMLKTKLALLRQTLEPFFMTGLKHA